MISMPKDITPMYMHKFFSFSLNQKAGYKASYIDWKNFNITNNKHILNLHSPQHYSDIVSTIQTNTRYTIKDIDIFRKTYFALSYFYYETNYRWFHRGTVDNIINVNILDDFYESLETKYDPLIQPVVLGGCIPNSATSFLQGGSGYLYSRKAAELILPIYEKIIRSCTEHEDVCHNEFIGYLNITMEEASSPNFLGHNFLDDDIKRLMNESFDDLPKCPKPKVKNKKTKCKEFHSPVNQIVFLHQHGKGISDVIEICKKIFCIKDDFVHFYFPKGSTSPKLCRSTD